MDDTVTLTVTIKHRTELAVLVDDGDIEVWLPLSQISIEDYIDGYPVEIEVPEWLAIEKGLV